MGMIPYFNHRSGPGGRRFLLEIAGTNLSMFLSRKDCQNWEWISGFPIFVDSIARLTEGSHCKLGHGSLRGFRPAFGYVSGIRNMKNFSLKEIQGRLMEKMAPQPS